MSNLVMRYRLGGVMSGLTLLRSDQHDAVDEDGVQLGMVPGRTRSTRRGMKSITPRSIQRNFLSNEPFSVAKSLRSRTMLWSHFLPCGS